MPEELERGAVGPVHVVDDDEQRRPARELGQQRRERVEQAQPLGAVLAPAQRGVVALRGCAQLGQQAGELGRARAEPGGERRERRAAGPAPQHLHERLVGRGRLVVAVPVEDDGAAGVRVPAQLGREPGLADPRLARDGEQAPAAVGGAGPGGVQRRRLGGAADEHVAAAGGREGRRPAPGDRRGLRAGRRRAAVQQPLVRGERRRAGRRAELLAQQPAQVVERPQGLRRVAGGLVRLHEQQVRGLAERGGGHGGPAAAASASPSSPPRSDAAASASSARTRRPASAPRCSSSHAPSPSGSRSPEQMASTLRAAVPAAAQSSACERRLGRAGGGARLLDVEPHRAFERQAHLGAPGQRALAERAAELGEQRAESDVGRRRRLGRPERVDQLAARARAVAVQREVGEEEAALAARQAGGQVAIRGLHLHRPTEPDVPP